MGKCMTNSTARPDNMTKTVDMEDHYEVWFPICLTVTYIMFVMKIWIATGFITFAKNSGILKRRSRDTDMDGGSILKAALVAVILPLASTLATTGIYIAGKVSHSACNATTQLSNLIFLLSLWSMHVFLWIRQRVFYRHPTIGQLHNKYISLLSKISIALLIIPSMIVSFMQMAEANYGPGPSGCSTQSHYGESSLIRYFMGSGISVLGKAILMGLIIYPLCIHYNVQNENLPEDVETRNITTQSEEGRSEDNQKKNKAKKKSSPCKRTVKMLHRLIKRTFVLAFVSMVIDILITVGGYFLPSGRPIYTHFALLEFELLVCVITVAGCFGNWKKIIFGFLRQKKRQDGETNMSTMHSSI